MMLFMQFGLNVLALVLPLLSLSFAFSEEERISLRDEVREMFTHAYDSYMKYAYPADELMPLSCKGRYRGVETNRGDVDDALGNFSLTLIDTLDTLVILGNYSEFEEATFRIVSDVSFDSDIVVSVFETNIRVIGGLLSAHVLAQVLKQKHGTMQWYDTQLLDMAKDVGYRLLPAFNTSTGIPHPRINLKYGMNSPKIGSLKETCTACAGTMILEFAALARLTGEHVFEEKARIAMDYLWKQRHRQSNLVGNVININTGDWIRKESGVGAGIDSYYEYCLKAYVLLGDENYLHRFNRHYAGVMKYVSQGPLLIDVHMHRPHSPAKNFMDSLLAFWPGLQVLKGDLKPAIETHEILYQIVAKHSFLPEAFTVSDFNVHWPHHPLRPEFVESTYFLYQATNDEHYLQVGKEVLSSLQNYTRVDCGYAAVNDVRTKKREDRMDSFFLAETLKYLYLLFSKKNEIDLNLEDYVFTTEGHLLPLFIGQMKRSNLNSSSTSVNRNRQRHRRGSYFSPSYDFHCPSTREAQVKAGRSKANIDNSGYYKMLRRNMKDFASRLGGSSFRRTRVTPRLRAAEFSSSKPEHVQTLRQLGISVLVLKDGRVKLIHNAAAAQSLELAEEGASFMAEMIALSKQQVEEEQRLRTVSFTLPSSVHANQVNITLLGGPAQFGLDLSTVDRPVEGAIIRADPIDACVFEEIRNFDQLAGKIVLALRGECMFIEKVRNAQRLGAKAMIIVDNAENSSSKTMPMFAMSGDGSSDVAIPAVFLYTEDAKILSNAIDEHGAITVRLDAHHDDEEVLHPDNDIIAQLFDSRGKYVGPEKGASSVTTATAASEPSLGSIFDMLNTDKFNLDILSSLNLKEMKDENMNLILSMLSKLALSKDQAAPAKATAISISHSYDSVTGARHCLNPQVNTAAFHSYLLAPFTICV